MIIDLYVEILFRQGGQRSGSATKQHGAGKHGVLLEDTSAEIKTVWTRFINALKASTSCFKAEYWDWSHMNLALPLYVDSSICKHKMIIGPRKEIICKQFRNKP